VRGRSCISGFILPRAAGFAACALVLSSLAVVSPVTLIGQGPPSERRAVDRAERLLNAGRIEEARSVLTQLLDRMPASLPVLSFLFELMQDFDGPRDFVVFVENAIASSPQNPSTRALWVEALLAAGFRDSASTVADRWIAQSPEEPLARIVRAEVQLAEGDTVNAIKSFQVRGERTEKELVRLAELLLAIGEVDELVNVWAELLAFDPPQLEVVVGGLRAVGLSDESRLRLLQDELMKWTGSTQRAGALVALRLRAGGVARQLAIEARGLGELQDADFFRDYLREADEMRLPREVGWAAQVLVELSPRPVDKLRWKTMAADQFLTAGDSALAQQILVELARENEPGEGGHNAAVRRLFALLAANPESLSEASDILKRYRIEYPDSVHREARMSGVLAIGHARAGDLPGGHQVLAGARTRMPSTGLRTLDATAARLSFYAGRRDSAIAQARRALSEEGLDPAEQTTRLQLLTLLQAGDSSEVAIVGEGTFKLLRDPSRFDPLQSLGALAAVPQTSGRPLALLYLADAAATEGRYEVARVFRLQVIQRYANSAEAPVALLSLAREAGQPEAGRWLEQLIVGYPDSALAPMARRLLSDLSGGSK